MNRPLARLRACAAFFIATVSLLGAETAPLPAALAPHFSIPDKFASDFGSFRSPLVFDDGTKVKSADNWTRRRVEILAYWQKVMGTWPPLIEKPAVEILKEEKRENFLQQRIRLETAPAQKQE